MEIIYEILKILSSLYIILGITWTIIVFIIILPEPVNSKDLNNFQVIYEKILFSISEGIVWPSSINSCIKKK